MSGNSEKSLFPEHEFLASCLRIGLTIQDLKILTYIDVIKMFISLTDKKEGTKKATQKDIDKLLG